MLMFIWVYIHTHSFICRYVFYMCMHIKVCVYMCYICVYTDKRIYILYTDTHSLYVGFLTTAPPGKSRYQTPWWLKSKVLEWRAVRAAQEIFQGRVAPTCWLTGQSSSELSLRPEGADLLGRAVGGLGWWNCFQLKPGRRLSRMIPLMELRWVVHLCICNFSSYPSIKASGIQK